MIAFFRKRRWNTIDVLAIALGTIALNEGELLVWFLIFLVGIVISLALEVVE